MTIGITIYNLRQEKDIKQKELADKVGITEATLSRYENDKRKPGGEILGKIAKALGVTTDYLLGQEVIKIDKMSEMCKKSMIREEKQFYKIDTTKDIKINKLIKTLKSNIYTEKDLDEIQDYIIYIKYKKSKGTGKK